jgi:hypothetical protein
MNKKLFVGVFVLVGITIFVIAGQQIRQCNILLYVHEDEILSSLNDGDVIGIY